MLRLRLTLFSAYKVTKYILYLSNFARTLSVVASSRKSTEALSTRTDIRKFENLLSKLQKKDKMSKIMNKKRGPKPLS